ncbi:adenylosuccinate lyase [Deinococcus soli (ex Cha et al. 2016)]|uniref:Adenylosuccinate lyase n=2 Tax=Deinococcus soli (ex Cha et al. 2016) TaxID=1309411 RepID=A0AAE4BLR3_9DEIO|nr:adenylosuccinate lyase [Deinococcus soli (ex Cha et al. 2016)]MDR6217687.1 adenylosuccinate lyase [Deinococcus soli (ex Cha et al. 2016)]MDR6326996.1 adenylosuccinate lyase [Deinococcus soli (ex Cha et al. 2016)]MDR6750278.1 adenylosuccinate lyase [Deinococcus soli (ex Cha et al. 2016)]
MIDRYLTPEMKALWSEASKYRAWLRVELAAMQAQARHGEVPQAAFDTLIAKSAADPLDEAFALKVAEIEAVTRHDIVAFTRALTDRYGDEARFIHHGLTSTDVVDTAQNLVLDEALGVIITDVEALREVCRIQAAAHKHTPTVGRTHGIHAEPMTFGLKFLNWMATLDRDLERLHAARKRIQVVMLSGSVGTFAHVSPRIEEEVAQAWGWQAAPVTNQTLARDRHAEVLSALAIYGTTVEKIAVEIRHLQRSEVREAMEPFGKGQTGSSSMPHKKNPILTENVTGLARLLRGYLLTGLENVPLWHERDISHSSAERVILPDATAATSYATRRLTGVLRDLVVFPERMLRNLNDLGGLVFSQRVLHALIDEKGLSREDAYTLVQRNALRSWETGEGLRDLLKADPESPLSDAELDAAFDLGWYLRHVDDIYARFGM